MSVSMTGRRVTMRYRKIDNELRVSGGRENQSLGAMNACMHACKHACVPACLPASSRSFVCLPVPRPSARLFSKHNFSKLRYLHRLFPISIDCLPGFWFLLFHLMPYRMTPSVRHRAIEVQYYYYYSRLPARPPVFLSVRPPVHPPVRQCIIYMHLMFCILHVGINMAAK